MKRSAMGNTMQKATIAMSIWSSLLGDGKLSMFLAMIHGEAISGRVKNPPSAE
jgi:hypothetical protein